MNKINELNIEHNEFKNISKFLPSYNNKIVLKDSEINFNSDNILKLSGLIKFHEKFEEYILTHTFQGKHKELLFLPAIIFYKNEILRNLFKWCKRIQKAKSFFKKIFI